MTRRVDGMHLDHALGQIDADANCNTSGSTDFPFPRFRLMTSNTTNLGASSPLQECGKSLHIPFSCGPCSGPSAATDC
jgi:hypothetical protein